MVTITQDGFNFIYRSKRVGELPVTETWGIERVAAFVFLIEFHRIRSQRYKKAMTFVSSYGRIQYELIDFDGDSNHDINKLTGLLANYIDGENSYVFYTSFGKALDIAEEMIKEKIKDKEAPMTIMGKEYKPPRFLSRPTEEEYKKSETTAMDKLKEQTSIDVEVGEVKSGTYMKPGSTIKVWFVHYGIIPCIIKRETPKYVIVDGFVNGKQVVTGARIRKGTGRIIE